MTHKISLPLLYAVGICKQDEFCDIFPRLSNDLLNGSIETLPEYIVNYKHLNIQEPSTDFEKQILKRMCRDAVETIDNVGENMASESFNMRNQEQLRYCFSKRRDPGTPQTVIFTSD